MNLKELKGLLLKIGVDSTVVVSSCENSAEAMAGAGEFLNGGL